MTDSLSLLNAHAETHLHVSTSVDLYHQLLVPYAHNHLVPFLLVQRRHLFKPQSSERIFPRVKNGFLVWTAS
jgi:hypothetical protein